MKTPQKDTLKQIFLQSIKEDIPTLKLVKYMSLIDMNPNIARELKTDIQKIALDNKLVAIYRQCCQKLGSKDYLNVKKFQQLRGQMVNQTNSLHNDVKTFKAENKMDKLAQALFNLGNRYFKYGDFKEASIYYSDLSNNLSLSKGQIKYEQFATKMALSLYYLSQFYDLSKFNSKYIQKNALKKLPDLCIIRDINNIDLECQRKNMQIPFKNVIEMQLSDVELSKNEVISYNDLGFLYSLLAIAYKKKSEITFIKWSSKLQNKYMNNKYKQVFDTITRQERKRCFLPIFNKIYGICKEEIKKRILMEIITSYDRCPYKIVQSTSGISQNQIIRFVRDNQHLPLLLDPSTQSVVYNRKVMPLYHQVKKLYDRLKRNLDEQVGEDRMEGQGIGMKHFRGHDDGSGGMRRGGQKLMGILGMDGWGGAKGHGMGMGMGR